MLKDSTFSAKLYLLVLFSEFSEPNRGLGWVIQLYPSGGKGRQTFVNQDKPSLHKVF